MGSEDKHDHKDGEARHKQFVDKVERGSDRLNDKLETFENGVEKGVQKGYKSTKNAFKNLKPHHHEK